MTPFAGDADQIAAFVGTTFRDADPETFVSLRAFFQDPARPLAVIRAMRLTDHAALIHDATRLATAAANHPEPIVVAPPVCTFLSPASATEANVANGLCIAAECDAHPYESAARLERLLGPPTVAVASGGTWADPKTGEVQDKLHLYWRLNEPTTTPEEHRRLRHARRLVALLAGSDMSAVPIAHPLRWPGTWHRKGKPRLAGIVYFDPGREVDLGDTLERLEAAAAAGGLTVKATPGPQGEGTHAVPTLAEGDDLAALAAAIPNCDADWDTWNRIGMAFFAAGGGGEPGWAAFHAWSARSAKHDAASTEARWAAYRRSPPTRLGLGTLVHLAVQADQGFVLPSRQRAARQGALLAEPLVRKFLARQAALVGGRTA
jgi:hypothetical protein